MPGLPFSRARAQCGYSLDANLPIPCLRCQGKNHSASAARAPAAVSLRPRTARARPGLGLFATQEIPKWAFSVEYKGGRVSNEEAERLEGRGNRYLYEINSRWTIDGTTRRNLGRYANHSCRPNAESARSKGKVILRAIKKIRP